MGHYHGIDLLVGDRGLIPSHIETFGIDFTSDLLCFHAVAGTCQQVHYGFFEFHPSDDYLVELGELLDVDGDLGATGVFGKAASGNTLSYLRIDH